MSSVDEKKRLEYIENCFRNISEQYPLSDNSVIIKALRKYQFFINMVAKRKNVYDVDNITEDDLLEYLDELLNKWNDLTQELGEIYIEYIETDIYNGDKKTKLANLEKRKQLEDRLKKVIREISKFNIEILDEFGSFDSLFKREQSNLDKYEIGINIRDIRSRLIDMKPENILSNLPGIISEILFYCNKIAKDVDALRLGSFIYSADYYKFSESNIDDRYKGIIYNRFKIIESFYSLCQKYEQENPEFSKDIFIHYLCLYDDKISKESSIGLEEFFDNLGLYESYKNLIRTSNYNELQEKYNSEFNSQRENKFVKDIVKLYNYSNAVSIIYFQKEWYILTLISQIVSSNYLNKFNNRSTEYKMFGVYKDERDKLVFFAFIPNYNAPITVHLNDYVINDLMNTPLPTWIKFYNKAPFGNDVSVPLFYPLTQEEIRVRNKKIAKPARTKRQSNPTIKFNFIERISDMMNDIFKCGYCSDFPKDNGTLREYFDRMQTKLGNDFGDNNGYR